MTTIGMLYQDYLNYASSIDNFKNIDKNEIVRLYIEHEFLSDKDIYFAGIMIKYWFLITIYFNKCKSLKLKIEDFVTLLGLSILKALKYRAWEDINSSLYHSKNGPYSAINRCFYSLTKLLYYNSNLDKNKTFYNTISTDSFDDGENTVDDIYYSNYLYDENLLDYNEELNYVIDYLIKHNRVDEYLILCVLKENVEDVFFSSKETTLNYTVLCKLLKELSVEDLVKLCNKYNLDMNVVSNKILYYKSISNFYLSKLIKESFKYIKEKELV